MDQILQEIMRLRRELHQHPELSMQEKETKERLITFLSEHTSVKIIDKGNWFYCVAGEEKTGAKIAFRAELDALPIQEECTLPYVSDKAGVSHACGHDGHAACLCGLAMMLEEAPVSRPVYLIFQPGEEIGAGGAVCARFVKEEGIEEIYAFHNLPGYPEGNIVYREGLTQPASEGLKIRFLGKASHASEPETGRNPSETIAKTILYIKELLEKPTEGMVLCTIVGIRAGSEDYGISAGQGELDLTLRAEVEKEMYAFETNLLSFVKRQGREEGLHIIWKRSDVFPETRNHGQQLDKVRQAAQILCKPCVEMDHLWRASEDFGYYTKEIPGAMYYIGAGEGHAPLHTVPYDFPDQILETGIRMFYELSRMDDPSRRDHSIIR
ncbi:MAG: amidohydrolase [Blautia sp.]|nr:amidohydrolase [Blautia sp.]